MPTFTLFATLPEAEARVPLQKLFTVRLPEPYGRVCLVRTADRAWRAFADACPHKLAAFSQGGYLNAEGEVVCPLHNYMFELQTGQETTGQVCPTLPVYKVVAGTDGVVIGV